jgi:cytoskeletal protein CcmA (bactofilin family)
VVNASVQAAIVLINGEVNGNVSASERVELRGQARLFGDVDAPSVAIEEGVLFEGQCKMAKAKRPDNGGRESSNGTSSNGGRDLSVVQMKR